MIRTCRVRTVHQLRHIANRPLQSVNTTATMLLHVHPPTAHRTRWVIDFQNDVCPRQILRQAASHTFASVQKLRRHYPTSLAFLYQPQIPPLKRVIEENDPAPQGEQAVAHSRDDLKMNTFVTHLESALDGTRFEAGQVRTVHQGRPLLVRYDIA